MPHDQAKTAACSEGILGIHHLSECVSALRVLWQPRLDGTPSPRHWSGSRSRRQHFIFSSLVEGSKRTTVKMDTNDRSQTAAPRAGRWIVSARSLSSFPRPVGRRSNATSEDRTQGLVCGREARTESISRRALSRVAFLFTAESLSMAARAQENFGFTGIAPLLC